MILGKFCGFVSYRTGISNITEFGLPIILNMNMFI